MSFGIIYLIGCLLSLLSAFIIFKVDHNRGHDFTLSDLVGYSMAVLLSYAGLVFSITYLMSEFNGIVLIKGKKK